VAEKPGLLAAELKRLRLAAGLTQDALAEIVGRKKSYISQLETGIDRFRSASDFAAKLSAALNVPLSHWAPFTSDGHLLAEAKTAVVKPDLGYVGAGPGHDEPGEAGATIEVPAEFDRADAVYRVRGTSMAGEGIQDGDCIAVIRITREPADREKVVAWVEGVGMVVKTIRQPVIGARARFLISQNGHHWQHELGEGDRVYGVYIGAFTLPKPPKKKPAKKSG